MRGGCWSFTRIVPPASLFKKGRKKRVCGAEYNRCPMKYITVCFILLCSLIVSCGGNSSPAPTPQAFTPFTGAWNVSIIPAGTATPLYTLGLNLVQSGTLFNGSFAPFTGGTAHTDSCVADISSFTAQGNTSGSSYSMTLTDSAGTHINIHGSLSGGTPTSSTYSTQYAISTNCGTDSGSVLMLRK